MGEHFVDDYTMSLIAGTNPNPRIDARWLVPDSARVVVPEPEVEEVVDEPETKVVDAPKRRGRRPAASEVETA